MNVAFGLGEEDSGSGTSIAPLRGSKSIVPILGATDNEIPLAAKASDVTSLRASVPLRFTAKATVTVIQSGIVVSVKTLVGKKVC